MFGPSFVKQRLVFFLLAEEEGAGRLTLIVY